MSQYTANTAPTRFVEAGGIRFAYRRFGTPERVPLLFTQHFMGNLNDFDPAMTDALGRCPLRRRTHPSIFGDAFPW
jgi:hypothetical protein